MIPDPPFNGWVLGLLHIKVIRQDVHQSEIFTLELVLLFLLDNLNSPSQFPHFYIAVCNGRDKKMDYTNLTGFLIIL